MGLRSGLFLAFALVIMITVLSLGAFHITFSPSTEEKSQGTSFNFAVYLRRIDWGQRSFDTYIEVSIEAWPENLSEFEVFMERWGEWGWTRIHLYPWEGGPQYSYRGNATTVLHFQGPTELYPYDRYMLNITFHAVSFGLINENSTWFIPQCQELGFDLTVDSGPVTKKFSTITYDWGDGRESASLNALVFLSRGGSSTGLIMTVLRTCFFLLGSLPLIKPEKLEHRLSICLSLFIFSATFTYALPIPTLTRATLAETLILMLLSGAAMFSVVSVIEKALIEARQSLAVFQFLIEGIVLFSLTNTLNQSLIWLIPPHTAEEYPWASLPPELFISLSFPLLYGYVSVTFFFLLNFVRKNKSKISKRIGAIHVFNR